MRRLIVLAPLAALTACGGHGKDFGPAKALIASHCAVCHTVPGVPEAKGKVGPSLAGIAQRKVIAGKFPNDRATLLRWITHSQQMLPGTAMPNSGLTDDQASTVADYLETLDGSS